MIVQKACEDFLNHCRTTKNLSANTLRAYAVDLEEFQQFVGPEQTVMDVDRHQLKAYLQFLFEKRKLKETSVKRRIACLKVFFRWLEMDEVIEISPFHRLDARIRLPRKLPNTLAREEVRQVLDEAAARVGLTDASSYTRPALRRATFSCDFNDFTTLVALEVLYCTGMRVGELAAIRLGDIDLLDGVITINGRGSRQRRVFLPDEASIILVETYIDMRQRQQPPDDTFLINSNGYPASTQHLRKLITQAGDQAGLGRRLTPHMLRHTCATHLLEAGLDIRFVQRLLGHQSISTTEGYTTVTDNTLKTAVLAAHDRSKHGEDEEEAEDARE